MATLISIKLKTNHEHAGKDYATNDVITVDMPTANLLIAMGVGERFISPEPDKESKLST